MSTVVITGASGGLGRALALAFARKDHQILLHYHRDRQQAHALAERLKRMGIETLIHQADLKNRHAVQDMAKAAVKAWGRMDIWINNAATAINRLTDRMSESEWDTVIRTNLNGVFYGVQEAARVMAKQREGHIINLASLAALRGNVGQAAYAASKAAIIGLTKTAARELGPFGVRINAVMPGYLPTAMTRDLGERYRRQMIEENVLGGPSDFAEVAGFIRHLSMMRNVSGQIFNLDSRIH